MVSTTRNNAMASLGLFIAILLAVAGITTALYASEVHTTYHIYNLAAINYDLNAAGAYCATYEGDISLEWRMRYPWTAFCGPVGAGVPVRKCLWVRNSGTDAQATVMIVDQCNQGGLDLEEGVFSSLDTDGGMQGYAQGHMITEYEFIDCAD